MGEPDLPGRATAQTAADQPDRAPGDRTAAERDAGAAARDETARLSDADATARDLVSDARDRAAARTDAPPRGDAIASDAEADAQRSRAAEDRARAAVDRARAADDRARAAEDRSRAAADRREAGIDLRTAHRRDTVDTRSLIARLRREADVHDVDLAALRSRLDSAELELEDLRAIHEALTPPELPTRPGLELAAAFLPAAERVGGDFYLVAEGPANTTVLVVGDVVGHGLTAARRAAFVRTAFIATAPFSDDPARLLSWVNTALIERAGTTGEFITAACLTYLPGKRLLRWAYAGHPPALWLDGGAELVAPQQGIPLGIAPDLECVEGSHRADAGAGVLLYTDGLTEARRDGALLGVEAVVASLAGLAHPTAGEAIATLSALAADFTSSPLSDDLCLLAARMG